jgi:hypothetical protein
VIGRLIFKIGPMAGKDVIMNDQGAIRSAVFLPLVAPMPPEVDRSLADRMQAIRLF